MRVSTYREEPKNEKVVFLDVRKVGSYVQIVVVDENGEAGVGDILLEINETGVSLIDNVSTEHGFNLDNHGALQIVN